MHQLSKTHFGVVKRMLMYIQGIKDFSLMFDMNEKKNVELFDICDSDWAGSMDDMKSIFGYTFTFGSDVFSWASKKQEKNDIFIHGSRICIDK
jgi:hypothetical protein